MSGVIKKCNTIRHIVRLRQMLRCWRRKAAAAVRQRIPYDVPAGHVVICVGSEFKRFVVRATYLNDPIFRQVLAQAEEEFGFANDGPLAIPCEESVFEEMLNSLLSRASDSASNSARFINLNDLHKCCHLGFRNDRDNLSQSRPLLRG